MKKILISAVAIALSGIVSANAGGLNNKEQFRTTGCNYTEYMQIQGPAGTHIIELKGNGIRGEVSSTTSFQIIGRCGEGADGNVVAKIGIDENHYSEMVIDDGQVMWNPVVSSVRNVGGFNFAGMEHPLGSYEYKLKFSH